MTSAGTQPAQPGAALGVLAVGEPVEESGGDKGRRHRWCRRHGRPGRPARPRARRRSRPRNPPRPWSGRPAARLLDGRRPRRRSSVAPNSSVISSSLANSTSTSPWSRSRNSRRWRCTQNGSDRREGHQGVGGVGHLHGPAHGRLAGGWSHRYPSRYTTWARASEAPRRDRRDRRSTPPRGGWPSSVSPSSVTSTRHRPVARSSPGRPAAAGTLDKWPSATPAAVMSWRNASPSSSSATFPR